MYCTCYSTIWPLPGSLQRTWSLNTLEQNGLRWPWKLPLFILLMFDSISDLKVSLERDAEQPSWGLLWVRRSRFITATPQLPQPLASWCVRTEKALAKRHEFWRRKYISDTSVAPVVLLNLRWFIPIPEAMRTANPSSSFWGEILPSSSWDCPATGKTSFCRCTFALCQSLMHQTPAFLWNEASRTCGGRWFGVKHDIKSHHLGWNRIILLRLQCFDAFLHVPEYIVHVPFLPLSAVLSAFALPSVVFVESRSAGARMFCSCGR